MDQPLRRIAAEDRQLAIHLAAARAVCALKIAAGTLLVAGTVLYIREVARAIDVPPAAIMMASAVPAVGLYAAVRALLRFRTLRRIDRRPETIELLELAMHAGRPAIRIGFADGASETLAASGPARDAILAALRRRAAGGALPAARAMRPDPRP